MNYGVHHCLHTQMIDLLVTLVVYQHASCVEYFLLKIHEQEI